MFRSIGIRRRGFGKGEFLGVRLVTVVVMVVITVVFEVVLWVLMVLIRLCCSCDRTMRRR